VKSAKSLLSLALLLVLSTPLLATPAEDIALGDAAWNRRAVGPPSGTASDGAISEAISAYEKAIAADSGNLEARWKLLRALYFRGEYLITDHDEKLAVYQRGRDLSDESRDLLFGKVGADERLAKEDPEKIAARVRNDPDSAPLYFWSAAHWGLWGRTRGKIAAARQGVAGKIRDYSQVVILIDDEMEGAGGHRVLGRLHSEAPKLPFVTGWVDRKTAVSELELAVEMAPDDALNRLYLAEALLEHGKGRDGEAEEILRDLVNKPPNPKYLVEEKDTIAKAKVLLEDLED
jgi:tetratricopeptide (TPR) repeat protein